MRTLYIAKDPTEYLTPGKNAAAERVALKRAARERAKLEGFDAIAIVAHDGRLIEQVSTNADIAEKRFVMGYRVKVRPTTPGFACNHPQNLDWAEAHGAIVATTNQSLTIHVPHPHELDALKNDFRFTIENVDPVWTNYVEPKPFIEKCNCKNPECKMCEGYGYVDKRDRSPVNYDRQRVLRTTGVIQ